MAVHQRYQVPADFAVTTHAFRELYLHGGRVVSGLARMREQVMTRPIPSHVQREIERVYSKLGGRVAVRSSMIGEDSSGASFAGQLDAVLGVAGDCGRR